MLRKENVHFRAVCFRCARSSRVGASVFVFTDFADLPPADLQFLDIALLDKAAPGAVPATSAIEAAALGAEASVSALTAACCDRPTLGTHTNSDLLVTF